MIPISPLRLSIAIGCIAVAAMLAIQTPDPVLQIIVILVGGLAALAVALSAEQEPLPLDMSTLERQKEKILFQGRADAYQDIINPIMDPVLLIRDARVAYANPSAQNVLGKHIIGEDVRVAIRHPAAADRLANPDAKHSGEPILLVGVGNRDQRWELRIRLLEDGLKLVHLSNQSDRHAAERMRTDFVANASHELRTPLAAIKGFIETLENPEAGADGDTRARFLKIMYEEADRMERLIRDLMSLSRIEAEKYELPTAPVDLGKLVHEAQSFFVTARGKKETDIRITLANDLPMVNGDHAQLTQLLHNLISNAFKYGHKGDPVEVAIQPNRNGSMLRLSVRDRGDGIEPDHIPRLTERFYRVDKGRSKAIGGTGLGLSIVKHITERHGGRMDIASTVGEGTTVSIALPVINSDG